MEFSYKAIVLKQVEGGKQLAFFAAPATDVELWGGVPQKKKFDSGEESAGFQREENQTRLKSISDFLKDPNNTIQNPLLCAIRNSPGSSFDFIPSDETAGTSTVGTVRIVIEDYKTMPLLGLLEKVQSYIENRIPALVGREPSEDRVNKLQERARESGVTFEEEPESAEGFENQNESEGGEGDSSAAIFEQSHIVEFWEEIAARRAVLSKIDNYSGDSFLGFGREALASYVKPIVVVDGQHRLKGALLAAQDLLHEDEAARTEAEQLIEQGLSPEEVEARQLKAKVRALPITLLLDADPAEHVFQFVVVNQKATQIGRALLGTIVSTSLSDEELEGVAERLRSASIPLDESRAASYMARHPKSPFWGLVELGMTNDNSNQKLQWAVFVALVNLFKDLKGGSPYHDTTDFATQWRRNHLDESEIVSSYAANEFESPYDYWRSDNGPWKGVFMRFWEEIRARFANLTDDQKRNYWGNPRRSNLFNKVSLNILASDFFKYMRSNRLTLNNLDAVSQHVSSWLEGVDDGYFDRDWELEKSGVKKDSPGIKHKWSKTWCEYRESPDRLPVSKTYRQPSTV